MLSDNDRATLFETFRMPDHSEYPLPTNPSLNVPGFRIYNIKQALAARDPRCQLSRLQRSKANAGTRSRKCELQRQRTSTEVPGATIPSSFGAVAAGVPPQEQMGDPGGSYAAMRSVCDLSKPLDISLFDQVIAAMYDGDLCLKSRIANCPAACPSAAPAGPGGPT
eukprot:gene16125-biopygen8428